MKRINSRLSRALLIFIITFAAYYPAIQGGFIWDDDYYVTENHLLTAPDGLWRIWCTTESPSQYFPLTYTLFLLEQRLWGFEPLGYHLVNIALHALNALLVWLLFSYLRIKGAWMGAALFALHPVHVESVAWVTELKNVLSGMFYLLALMSYLKFEDTKKWGWYGGSFFLFSLALLSKMVVLSLPLVVLLVRWWRGRRIGMREVVLQIPFMAAGLGMGLLARWWEMYHQGTRGEVFDFSFIERFLIAGRALWFYLIKLFWPLNLAFSYPRWEIDPLAVWQYGWHLGLVGGGYLLWRFKDRWGRGPAAAYAIFAVTLAPMLGFINYYTMLYSFVADHYQYLASLAVIAVAVGGVKSGFERMRGGVSGAVSRRLGMMERCAGLSVLVLCGVLTWQQGYVYRDSETLWQDTLTKNPESWMAYNNLGVILAKQGEYDRAIVYYKKSLQIKPEHAKAHNNLGTVYRKKGLLNDAIEEYRKALDIAPAAEFYNNLGTAYLEKGEIESAIEEYRRALAFYPRYAEAYMRLGSAYQKKGMLDDAIVELTHALTINPRSAEAHNALGTVYRKQGRVNEAMASYRQALTINPQFTLARYNLGNGFLRKRNFDEAVSAYKKVLAVDPDHAETHNNLSVAYSSLKNYQLAIAHCDKAVALGYEVHPVLLKNLAPYR